MRTFTIICLIPWILLYFCTQLLSIKADNCIQTCGNLTLPYPFQLDQNTCGLPGFEITCRGKSSSNPGIPFLETLSGPVQIRNISDDHILVDAAALYGLPCNRSANFTSAKGFNLSDEGPFRISAGNNFFMVGCNTYGEFRAFLATGTDSDSYTGSCYSTCNQTSTVKPWDCKDNTCCKIPVPGGYTRILVAAVFKTSDGVENCSYSASAIVDQDSFGSNPGAKFQLQGARYSMQLDWAIPNNTYSWVRLGHISYQCAQNAIFEDKGWGYLCKCNGSYTGDGYANGTGCTGRKGSFDLSPSILVSKLDYILILRLLCFRNQEVLRCSLLSNCFGHYRYLFLSI